MKRSLVASALAVVASALTLVQLAAVPAQATSGIGEQAVITGRAWPAAFTFAPNGRIYYAERYSGRIKIWSPSSGTTAFFYRVTNLRTRGEGGVLGIALDPNYASGSPFVYVYATRLVGGVEKGQILKMKYVNGTATDVTTIFTSPEVTGTDHVGGRLLFGPDGMLYLIIGDSQRSGNAQDTGTSFGKMLRMTSSGHTPSGNQYPGREWAIGIRNSYGFTFDFAHTGLMWETENGPECNDELNQIDGGNNQGWGPNENCDGTSPDDTNNSGPNPVFPLLWYTPTIAPTGAVFCDGCGLTGADGDLFFGTYNTANVHEVTLTSDRTGVTGDSIVLTHSEGVLSMERGPDGTIYFSDSNAIYKLVNT